MGWYWDRCVSCIRPQNERAEYVIDTCLNCGQPRVASSPAVLSSLVLVTTTDDFDHWAAKEHRPHDERLDQATQPQRLLQRRGTDFIHTRARQIPARETDKRNRTCLHGHTSTSIPPTNLPHKTLTHKHTQPETHVLKGCATCPPRQSSCAAACSAAGKAPAEGTAWLWWSQAYDDVPVLRAPFAIPPS